MVSNLEKRDVKDLDNVSKTAYRIISILNMLVEAPCNEKEINEKLQSGITGEKSLSQDTICLYINTLRAIGCSIERSSKTNNFKYVLNSHPFKLRLEDKEICSLIEIRKHISNLEDWKLVVNINKLLNTILENLAPENKKGFLLVKDNCARYIETTHQAELIDNLEKYCEKKRAIQINYASPDSGDKIIELITNKLHYENNSLYLSGYNSDLDEEQILRIDRIKEIKAVKMRSGLCGVKEQEARYKLTGIAALLFAPSENETVIEKKDKEIIVEAKITNKFKFIQKIMYYGSDCVVLFPEAMRKEIINKFSLMLNSYEKSV